MAKSEKLIIAGGGLAGCLAALAIQRLRPEQDLLLIEQEDTFGGNHIWSFFDPDIAPEHRWLVDPLIIARWPAHDVAFPGRRRSLAGAYNSLASSLLDEAVRSTLPPDRYRTGTRIAQVGPSRVELASGETLDGTIVDARGPGPTPGLHLAWQKFVGQSWRFARPHGLERPLIMDATVDQSDGYRFVYCLPFAADRMLIEDTYYSLSPGLDVDGLRRRIAEYAEVRGWALAACESEEQGVLPVALGGSIQELWNVSPGVPRIGIAGGFFHPTTGYSLPDAVRIALAIASQPDSGQAALHARLRTEARGLWRDRRFYRLLNRMLFHAADPGQRYRVLEHFYRLDAAVIGRFYAGRSTRWDKLRIVSGKPPVPVARAIRAILT